MSEKPSPEPPKPDWNVFHSVLDYIKAMTSAPSVDPEEREEWLKLKNEFSTRCDNEKKAG